VAVSSAEVLDVMAVGVCGSDVQRLRSGYDVRSLGHELVGRRPSDGTLVAIRPLNPCQACPACVRGWTEQCASDTSIGRMDTGEGGFSGRVRAQPGQLYPISECLPVVVATLADPLACAVHAFHGMSLDGKDLLIIGDGPMAAIAAVYAASAPRG
jgi:L-iditol 2-dehydrogenase